MDNPFKDIDGQLMVQAAHGYCLGRKTYMVPVCIDYLKRWWDRVDQRSRANIVRDTAIALADGRAGMDMDVKAWTEFAEWSWPSLTPESQTWCRDGLASTQRVWPLKESQKSTEEPLTS